MIAGYGLSALSKLFFPISSIWQQVFLLRILERSGKGIRAAPRDAIIANSSTIETRGRGSGILRAMDSSGAVIGSALAYIFSKEFSYEIASFISLIMMQMAPQWL